MTKKSLKIIFIIIICFIGINTTFSTSVNIIKTTKISNFNEYKPKETWNKTFGGTNLDWGWSVQETTDGGFIIAGETVSFGSGGYDAWLIKTDSNGNEIWNKTYGGTAKDGVRSVKQTNDSGYIIGGYTDSYGNPGHDVWLIKTNDEGNEEWNSIFGGSASDATFSVWQTIDEGYVAVGYVNSYGAGDHDTWLIKTDMYGNEEWNKTYGTAEWDLGNSVQQTSDGGYIIIGATKSYGSGNQDAWLIKTDMYGNEEWNKTYGGTLNDWGSAVVMTDDGGYLITGDTQSYGSGGYDVWLIKTNIYGNEEWNKTYGDSSSTDTGYSLKKTSDNGFVITGTKTTFSTGLTDIWLIKTDNDGYMQWNLTLDGGEDDWSYSVDETMDGGYIITGLTNSYGSGGYDLWLIKVELENSENQPPNMPCDPYPPDNSNFVDVNTDLSWNCSDPDGDKLVYDVYFEADDPDPDVLVSDDQTQTTYEPGTLLYETTYYWQIIAKDEHGASIPGPIWHFTTEEEQNNPPGAPTITGTSNGKVGEEHCWTISSVDPDGDDVMYIVDWGDGETTETECYPSGMEVEVCHTYTSQGTYVIKVKAKECPDGLVGPEGTLKVTMPRNKIFNFNFNLLKFLLERFPNAFPILRNMIEM
jgi:hypothetical protein